MRVSQRQLKTITGEKSSSDLRAQMAKLQETLAKEPLERVVYVQLPPVEKIVEKVVYVDGPTKIEEKIVEKIVEVKAPQPIFTFGVKERNSQGRITRMAAASSQTETRFEFNVLRDKDGNLSRVTMKAVKPDKNPTLYGALH